MSLAGGKRGRALGDVIARELGRVMARGELVTEGPRLREATQDGTANRGEAGSALALALPADSDEVAAVVAWCYRHDMPIVPRGGGTGLAAGAVPDQALVVSLASLRGVRSLEPGLWRMQAEAGVRTADVHRLALENGLMFPPDPGASEQSTLGGNIATNAGGPHAFKYGVTGNWVTGLEVVIAPGERIDLGGPYRKDVSGYDLVHLLVGSEGTLGLVTAAWLRLLPAPPARAIVCAFYPGVRAGCAAVAETLASGIEPAALEYLDGGALRASLGSFPIDAPATPGFAVIAEVDGSDGEVARRGEELSEALSSGALSPVSVVGDPTAARRLWAWRDGVPIAVAAQRGGKVSEDIVVPLEHLAEAIEGVLEIGARHSLPACSWGHAGDGNLHATFQIDLGSAAERRRAIDAAAELFDLALQAGGSISGEHGIGALKTGRVMEALGERAVAIEAAIKDAFDPKGLLNPGKKLPARSA